MEHGKLVIAHFSLETNNNEHAVKVKQSHLGSVGLCADSRKAEKHNGGEKNQTWKCPLGTIVKNSCLLKLSTNAIYVHTFPRITSHTSQFKQFEEPSAMCH